MKKIYRGFVIFSVIPIGAFGAAAICLSGISGAFGALAALIGAAVWTAMFARFKSIEYIVENSRLVIRRGILFRSETSLKKSSILWTSTVRFGSATLFSVLHTASGSVIVFAELDPDILPKTLGDAKF